MCLLGMLRVSSRHDACVSVPTFVLDTGCCGCSAQVETKAGVKACAIKRLPWTDPYSICTSSAELCAMWETRDLPGLAKCCGIFLDSSVRHVVLATE